MSELQTLAEMTMLDPNKCIFSPTDGGYISLKYEDKTYDRVKISRALPYKAPDEYICIIDKDGNEIGILKDIKDLSKEKDDDQIDNKESVDDMKLFGIDAFDDEFF